MRAEYKEHSGYPQRIRQDVRRSIRNILPDRQKLNAYYKNMLAV